MNIFRSIITKLVLVFCITGVALFAISRFNLMDSLTKLQTNLIGSRLHSDIQFIRTIIGNGEWSVKNGTLYHGRTRIGDGTVENANLAPFLECEKKTGTFSYTFIKCSDEGLEWVGDEKTGYMQGHFLRVAGSTLGPSGESIVGTYMDKQVADALDKDGIYQGPANVSGRQIYCVYETLLDRRGEVVGAIVVGRGIQELEDQISRSSVKYTIITIIALLAIILLLLFTIIPWIRTIRRIQNHLKIISNGDFPDEPLEKRSKDEIGRLTSSINEMTNSLREKEVLRHLATRDPLTELYNRGALESKLKQYISVDKGSGALFMLDLDHFKEVNDTLGHPVGDELLIDISETLQDIFRTEDIIARLGGDEFVCFAKGFVDEELLVKRADEILTKCKRVFADGSGGHINVTTSIGVALFPKDGLDYDELYSNADKALYIAKTSGRNCYKFFSAQ